MREHWRQEGRRSRRNAAPAGEPDELFACLAAANQLLEIGPFDNPSLESLRRPGLQIDYADQFSREEMVERARLYPERDPDAIPPIRYVLGQGGYGQIEQRYDAVVSHHCLEHQPDLIGHLLQVSRLLKPGGLYLFTVPDQRRCFDRYLPPTTLIDVVTAHLEGRTRPPCRPLLSTSASPWPNGVRPPTPWSTYSPIYASSGFSPGGVPKPPLCGCALLEVHRRAVPPLAAASLNPRLPAGGNLLADLQPWQ